MEIACRRQRRQDRGSAALRPALVVAALLLSCAAVLGQAIIVQNGAVIVRQQAEAEAQEQPKFMPLVNADEEIAGYLRQAQTLVEEGRFNAAIEILQAIINREDGGFYGDDLNRRYVAMRLKAVEAIGEMPDEGLALYRTLYDGEAAEILRQATATGDLAALRRVATIYTYTSHGPGALDLLGALLFDRGQFDQAARCWDALLGLDIPAQRKSVAAAKLAIALHLAGREALAKEALAKLDREYPQAKAEMSGRDVDLARFAKQIMTDVPVAHAASLTKLEGWPGLGALPGGSGLMDEVEAVLVPRYLHPHSGRELTGEIGDKLVALRGLQTWAKQIAQQQSRYQGMNQGNQPVIDLKKGLVRIMVNYRQPNSEPVPLPPSIMPVVAGDTLIYQSDERISALDLDNGKLKWQSEPFPMERDMPSAPQYYGHMLHQNVGVDPGRYWLTIGENLVFATGEYRPAVHSYQLTRIAQQNPNADVGDNSTLLALSVESGREVWRVGRSHGDSDVLKLGSFISPPAYSEGRLYLIVEYLERHHLVCLDARTGSLLWETGICQVPVMRSNYGISPIRCSPPMIHDGRAFVSNGAGILAAFDVQFGQPLWAYQYRDANVNLSIRMQAGVPQTRGVSPLVVSQGQLLCLPADSEELMALSPDTGELLWSVDRQNQSDLTVLDSERLLLSSPGLIVMSARDGGVVHEMSKDLGVVGKPAVTARSVLASAPGMIHRLDLVSGYRHSMMALADPDGLLGNLVAVNEKLIAANPLGVCVYFGYEDEFARLSEVIEAIDDPAKLSAMLMDRGQISFNAHKADRALGDFLRAAELVDAHDVAQLEAMLRVWLHRTYISLGARAQSNQDRLKYYQEAMANSKTPQERGHMMIRLAKTYVAMDRLTEAAGVMEQLGHEMPEEQLVDIGIGPESDVVRFDPRTPTVEAGILSGQFVRMLIDEHGREFYAKFETAAAEALAKARTESDGDAMLTVASRYPNARVRPTALYEGAQLLYEQSSRGGGGAGKMLEQAMGALAELANISEHENQRDAALALAMIYHRRGHKAATRASLRRLQAADKTRQFDFGDFHGNVGELIRKLAPDGVPTLERPQVAADYKPGLDLEEPFLTILCDSDGKPAFVDGKAAVQVGDFIRLVDLTASQAKDATVWEAVMPLPDLDNRAFNPQFLQPVATLSEDGKVLAVAVNTVAFGFDVKTGKQLWSHQMEGVRPNFSIQPSVGEGVVLLSDRSNKVECLDAASGKVRWRSEFSSQRPAKISHGLAVMGTMSWSRMAAFDLDSGKILARWQQRQATQAEFSPDGLLVVMTEDKLEVFDPEAMDKPLWTRKYDQQGLLSMVGTDVVVVQPSLAESTVEVLSLTGGGAKLAELPLGSSGPSYVMAGQQSGNELYLMVNNAATNANSVMYARERAFTQDMALVKLDFERRVLLWREQIKMTPGIQVVVNSLTVGKDSLIFSYSNRQNQSANIRIHALADGKLSSDLVTGKMGSSNESRIRYSRIGRMAIRGGRMLAETIEGARIYEGK
jgi:outer membrane protein assembly factor BamB